MEEPGSQSFLYRILLLKKDQSISWASLDQSLNYGLCFGMICQMDKIKSLSL